MVDQAARTTHVPMTRASPAQARVLLIGPRDGLGVDPTDALRGHRLVVHGPVWPTRFVLDAHARPFDAAIIDVDAGHIGYNLVLQLAEAAAPCRSVILGSNLDRASVREAFLAGVVACLRKPVDSRVLAAALRRAVDATRVMRRCIDDAEVSMTAMEIGSDTSVDLSVLTRRESEILELVMEGRSTRDMAGHLSVSERTVKFHVSNVLRKLGVDSRLSLLAKLRHRRDAW
jgi:DNA-binding NarL/FixJ family response regulator